MSQAEDHHWWYLGMRDAIARCLSHPSMRLPDNPKVLDAGCGTGGNLCFLNRTLSPSYLAGFDLSERALEHAHRKCPEADIYLSDLRAPEIREDDLDLIISCDVLYVTGILDSLNGLRRLSHSLKQGGLLVWNLPAFDWLTSHHDRVVHTKQRFTRGQLKDLSRELEMECVRISYRLFGLFPVIASIRLAANCLMFDSRKASDLRQPNRWVNEALLRVLKSENRMIANGISFPVGTSVFAVFRKC
ncbi:MAG: class I SAM-dependent methyltransferase [Pirellula sp.]